MHSSPSPLTGAPSLSATAVDAVLREARRLHRAATSSSLETSLPVLRRLLGSGAIPSCPLSQCHRQRASVQRKHLLRMLAVEAGHASWEAWRRALGSVPASAAGLDYATLRDVGRLKHWFRDETEARAWSARRGGVVMRAGAQVAVLPCAPEVDHA